MDLVTEESAGAEGRAGKDAVEELVASGALDELFARIDAGEVELTGDGGLIPGLIKAALAQLGLQTEPLYSVIYLDALVVKVRDGAHVANKAAHHRSRWIQRARALQCGFSGC